MPKRKTNYTAAASDRLNITNKAVSKWETGNGFPDISLLTELADILDVSVDEILKAKKNEKAISTADISDKAASAEKEISHNSDMVISYLVHKSIDKFKMMSIISIFISVVGLIIQYFIWTETKNLTGWLFGCWFEICSGGVYIISER
jgi:transcriptional regulator with XRE-family HTH domain